MVFNSLEFLVFAIVFFLIWPLVNKRNNSRWWFIVVMSAIFYGWWDWRFLFLILASGLIDYFCGLQMRRKPSLSKAMLVTSLVGNLGGLAIFKYSGFIAEVADDFCTMLGVQSNFIGSVPEFALILPVGISFYTFQSMSYSIDVYRKRIEPTSNVLHFFSYLAMFPQLVAGPIVRAKDMLQQLTEYRPADALAKWNGIKLIVYGLFQKMVIADNLSFLIDSAYQDLALFDGALFWWVVLIAFAFQIYCDFSGYSLIAKGLAKYMGYNFKMNFNHPYLALGLRDFWSRWHISLSTWFRDYIYIPLGGSRKGVGKAILFVCITMLLSGLWHGANYTFLAWGAIHAILLSIERITQWTKKMSFPFGAEILSLLTFVQVVFAWNYFRADDIEQANAIAGKLFTGTTNLSFLRVYFDSVVFLCLAIVIELIVYVGRKNALTVKFFRNTAIDVAVAAVAVLFIVLFAGEGAQFIYFQF